MSKKQAKSIPSWQREDAPSLSSGAEYDAEDHAAPSNTSRASVVEKASRSVQDDGMQDAPIERKTTLMISKGSSDPKNDELEGVSRTVKNPSEAADNAQVNDSLVMRKNVLFVLVPRLMLTPYPFPS